MKLIFSVSFVLFFIVSTGHVSSQSMIDEGYNLELQPADDYEKIEVTPLPTSNVSKKITSPKTQQMLRKPPDKTISIDINSDLISFGVLSPTSPSEREIDIAISGSSPSQIIYIKKNNQLQNESDNIINDTSCDQGTCSRFIAANWINTLTFGIGYSCKHTQCEADFTQTAYRPFALELTSLFEVKKKDSQISSLTLPIRINIPGTQEKGVYQSTLTILAVPGL